MSTPRQPSGPRSNRQPPRNPSPRKADARSIRRLAMQALYQIDVTGDADPQAVMDGMDEEFDLPEVRDDAAALAVRAWHDRQEADGLVQELAPDWPTHRQPPVDRAILRLAYHEMKTGRVHPRIAINEAVELAKQFAAEQSPAFINGVLDKIAKRVTPEGSPQAAPPSPPTEDEWLRDAVDEG